MADLFVEIEISYPTPAIVRLYILPRLVGISPRHYN